MTRDWQTLQKYKDTNQQNVKQHALWARAHRLLLKTLRYDNLRLSFRFDMTLNLSYNVYTYVRFVYRAKYRVSLRASRKISCVALSIAQNIVCRFVCRAKYRVSLRVLCVALDERRARLQMAISGLRICVIIKRSTCQFI